LLKLKYYNNYAAQILPPFQLLRFVKIFRALPSEEEFGLRPISLIFLFLFEKRYFTAPDGKALSSPLGLRERLRILLRRNAGQGTE